ncbi:GIY-YIG nuclease family protein [uncultured Sunxiuqinia sp.]|uniref:GIY-YIG nuclease family protein n=1 Tax=uncultured Sunxiuqinia sp. TaxID=1573825 RepID=UPI002617886A|nr:GIY-YIG nuclease family protein [uncultured Sunxiuqinia sp.]
MREKWTERRLHDKALMYQHRNDFKKGSPKAYDRARKLKLLDQICGHMEKQRKSWSEEKIQKEANKYNRRIDFQKQSSKAYDAARHHGILDKVCCHMIPERIQWNTELARNEALKYESKVEFKKNSLQAYRYACKNGIMRMITSHMKNKRKEWNAITISKEALKYRTLGEFQSSNRSAYQAARNKNILEEVCSHMKKVANLKERSIYVIFFPIKNSFYVGLTYNFSKRIAMHKNNSSNQAVRELMARHTPFKAIEIIKNVPMNKAGKLEEKYRKEFINEGYICLNKNKTGALGGARRFWTPKKIAKEAQKYTIRTQFRDGSPGAYNAALDLKIIDDVCSHMMTFMNKWDESSILNRARRFTSTKELISKEWNIYVAAQRRSMLSKIKELYGE